MTVSGRAATCFETTTDLKGESSLMQILRTVTHACLLCLLLSLASSLASAQTGEKPALVPVTVENFTRAETDVYFRKFVDVNGLGRFRHGRQPASVDSQDVIRMNLDTFYSSAVFDLDAAPVTSKLTASTLTLSLACAVIVTVAPGSASRGPLSVMIGGARSAAAVIVALVVAAWASPLTSVTVSVTV